MDLLGHCTMEIKKIDQAAASIPPGLRDIFVRAVPPLLELNDLNLVYSDDISSEVRKANALMAELENINKDFKAAGGTTSQWSILCKPLRCDLLSLREAGGDGLCSIYYAAAKEKTVKEFGTIPENLRDLFAVQVLPALRALGTFSEVDMTSVTDQTTSECLARLGDLEVAYKKFISAGGTRGQRRILADAADFGLFNPR